MIDFLGASLDAFAKDLHPDGRHVIDQTGLAGTFDIHLEFEADGPDSKGPGSGAASDPSPHSGFIVAMRQQLGLRLDPGKGPGEFLVIDRIERPSGNYVNPASLPAYSPPPSLTPLGAPRGSGFTMAGWV